MLAGTLLPTAVFTFISDSADRLSWMLFTLLVLTAVICFVLKREERRERKAARKGVEFVPRLSLSFCGFVLTAFLLEIVVITYAAWVNEATTPTLSQMLFLQTFTIMDGGMAANIIGSALCGMNVYMALLLNRRLLLIYKLDLGWKSVLKMVVIMIAVAIILTFAMIFAGISTHTDAYTYSIILLAVVCGLASIAYDCITRNKKSLIVIPYLLASSFFLLLAGMVIFAIFAIAGALYCVLWYKRHTIHHTPAMPPETTLPPKGETKADAEKAAEADNE